jgi:hypothetical protein
MNSSAILRIAGLDTSTSRVMLGRDPSAVAIVPVRLQKRTLDSVDVSNTSELFDVSSVSVQELPADGVSDDSDVTASMTSAEESSGSTLKVRGGHTYKNKQNHAYIYTTIVAKKVSDELGVDGIVLLPNVSWYHTCTQ